MGSGPDLLFPDKYAGRCAGCQRGGDEHCLSRGFWEARAADTEEDGTGSRKLGLKAVHSVPLGSVVMPLIEAHTDGFRKNDDE